MLLDPALGHLEFDPCRGRPDARLKTYPDLNHLFMASSGPAGPTEYQRPGHVAEAVVEDITAWIRL